MLVVGLMSGTSVDGIDAALVEIDRSENEGFRWRLVHFVCVPWEPEMREAILSVCRPDAPLQKVTALHFRVGEAFARAARRVVEDAGYNLDQIDAIASHGQTVWHQPEPYEIGGMAVTGTLQIGEPAVIAARTGCRTVADFRPADMAVGGQGAPLVPFADYTLFRSETEHRIVQNIGGIANLTYLPAGGRSEDLVAFDTGPGNMLIDALAARLSNGQRQYDTGGAWAAEGKVLEEVLERFLTEDYFLQKPPRTTGRERFGAEYAGRFLDACLATSGNPADVLATATCLTAESIWRAYRDFLACFQSGSTPITVIVGGGGVYNQTLMGMLRDRIEQERIAPARLSTHRDFGLSDDAKEAVAFAILGYETLAGRPANIPVATGARRPAILGKICLPPPI